MSPKKKILIISNKDDFTSDFVVKVLHDKRADFYRLNTDEINFGTKIELDFIAGCHYIYDSFLNKKMSLTDFDSIYFRRPKIVCEDNEYKDYIYSETKHLLEGIYLILENKFWINNPFDIKKAENKIYQLKVAKELEFLVPETIITNNKATAENFLKDYNSITKPIKTRTWKDSQGNNYLTFTSRIEKGIELTSVEKCPTKLQRLIEKTSDIRVTIVKDKIFSHEINSQDFPETSLDWRLDRDEKLHYKIIELPLAIQEKCLNFVNILNLTFGAIDLIKDQNGDYWFLEINPNGQWAWLDYDFKISNEIANNLMFYV